MNDFDECLSQWAEQKRRLEAPSRFGPRVLAAVQRKEAPSNQAFEFSLPNPLATPICLAIGFFKFAFILQLAF
ncbi:MAG: hypothetical protein AAF514_19490 [Verrucomicrobiota bacterium]